MAPNTAVVHVWPRNAEFGWKDILGAYDRVSSVNVGLLNNAGFVLERTPTLPGPTWTVLPPASYQTDATSVCVVLPATLSRRPGSPQVDWRKAPV